MRITRIRVRNVGWRETPQYLQSATTSPISVFPDARTRSGGWFGPIAFSLVELESDDGTIGIGYGGAGDGSAASVIEHYYADLVLGEDPRNHERIWQRLFRSSVRFGRSGAAISALSAVDIACWDLHGKHDQQPVYRLLNGLTREKVPAYASRLYATSKLDVLAEEAKRYVDDGFDHLKQRFGYGPTDGPAGVQKNVELVATVREAVGDAIRISGEAYMGWDRNYSLEMAKRLREYDLHWIEEPLMPYDVEGYVYLRTRCPWQLWSCGEHSYTKWDFAELLRRQAVDIIQPDANRMGGITELMKVCAMAEASGIPVIPHSTDLHNLHVIFSQAPHVCPLIEYFPDLAEDAAGNTLFRSVFSGNPSASNGHLDPPPGPGLGIAIEEAVVSELQVGNEKVLTR